MEDANEVDIDDLNSLKTQLNMLEEKVKVDMENDKYVTEDVEKIIQQFLTVIISSNKFFPLLNEYINSLHVR